MTGRARVSRVQTELALRLTCAGEPGTLARVLKVLQGHGGAVLVSVTSVGDGRAGGLLLCPDAVESALALRREGFEIETETVVTVRTPDGPGVFAHLVATLGAEDLNIVYALGAAVGGDLLAVFRTNENPRAEDALRNYLFLPDLTLGPKRGTAPAQPA